MIEGAKYPVQCLLYCHVYSDMLHKDKFTSRTLGQSRHYRLSSLDQRLDQTVTYEIHIGLIRIRQKQGTMLKYKWAKPNDTYVQRAVNRQNVGKCIA